MTHDTSGSPDKPPLPPAAELLLSAIVDSSDDAIVSKDLNGVVTSWNKGAERLFGYSRDEMIGRSIKTLLPADRQTEEDGILSRVRSGERVEHFETLRRRKDGRMIDVALTVSPIRAPDGRVVGASKIGRDITERKRGSRSDLLLAAIVNSSDDAIVSKDLNGIITSWNAGAQRIFGYSAEEMIGQPVLKLLPDDRKDEEPRILSQLRQGERVEHFETERVKKNGERIHVSLTISPVRDHTGQIVGASKIARDITTLKRISAEREQLLESERAARAQAEAANRLKDDFLATVSHELRTPLNAIVGWTEVLKLAVNDPREVANGVEVIARNAFAQAQLIEDLLDLSRISTGKMTLHVENVDVAAIVRDAVASVQHAADVRQIEIKTILSEYHGAVTGDSKRLRQIVWNLLTNAIKFTPDEGRVTVTLTRVNSNIEITVADTGRGIAPEFLPFVFERFRQADSSITRRYGGLGIGLALVKQLVELHAGMVKAESPGPNRGATFRVSLPVAASPHGPEVATPTSASADALADLGGVRVLAVDDDKDSLEVLGRILRARNAEVFLATSADEAVQAFTTFRPDVVLSDIGMPGKDGYDLIGRLRQLPHGSTVPAAALTAMARSDDRMRALRAGFQTHVAKPVAAAEIAAVVNSLASLGRTRSGSPV